MYYSVVGIEFHKRGDRMRCQYYLCSKERKL